MLRPSLLPGLIDACAHNRRRGRKDIRLFETGSRFTPATGKARGGGRLVRRGRRGRTGRPPRASVDFFDVKGVVEQRLRDLRRARRSSPRVGAPFLAPRRAAAERTSPRDGTTRADRDPRPAAAGDRRRARLPGRRRDLRRRDSTCRRCSRSPPATTSAPSRCRAIRRSSATSRSSCPTALPAATVRGTIRSSAPPTLVSIVEFDRYTGKGVPAEQVSLSLRLTFRAPDRTLTDDEVQTAMAAIVAALGAGARRGAALTD